MHLFRVPGRATPANTEEGKTEQPKSDAASSWLQVVGVFAMWTNTFGLVNAYGEFQTYYESIYPQTPSQIAWIGSLQGFLPLLIGLITGPLFDMGFFRSLNITGNLLIIVGMMLTSICKQYWQVLLAQGVMIGIGMGCLFSPTLAVLPQWFTTRLQFASGIAAVGSGFGGVVYPIVLRQLVPKVGFPWAVRVLGFLTLFFAILALSTLRCKSQPLTRRQVIPKDVFQDVPLMLFIAGDFLILVSLYIPSVYITSYSIRYKITSPDLAFYMVPILQATNIGGRFLSFFADRIGPLNLTIPAQLIAAILAFCWIAVRDVAGILVFVVLYGIVFGMMQGMAPGCVASLTPDKANLGGRMGFTFGIAGFGALIGTPVAGVLLGGDDNFVPLQIFTGAVLAASTVCYVACRLTAVGSGLAKI